MRDAKARASSSLWNETAAYRGCRLLWMDFALRAKKGRKEMRKERGEREKERGARSEWRGERVGQGTEEFPWACVLASVSRRQHRRAALRHALVSDVRERRHSLAYAFLAALAN